MEGNQALLIVRSDRPQVDPSSIAERDVALELAGVVVDRCRHRDAVHCTRHDVDIASSAEVFRNDDAAAHSDSPKITA